MTPSRAGLVRVSRASSTTARPGVALTVTSAPRAAVPGLSVTASRRRTTVSRLPTRVSLWETTKGDEHGAPDGAGGDDLQPDRDHAGHHSAGGGPPDEVRGRRRAARRGGRAPDLRRHGPRPRDSRPRGGNVAGDACARRRIEGRRHDRPAAEPRGSRAADGGASGPPPAGCRGGWAPGWDARPGRRREGRSRHAHGRGRREDLAVDQGGLT